MKDLGIYVHIPFCKSKCLYCDFNSYSGADDLVPGYFSALLEEIDQFPSEDYLVKTIFFGGGTPTIAPTNALLQVLDKIKSKFKLDKNAEISLEANPATVTQESLRALRNAGFNRISFGLQSANNLELKALGRIHSFEDFLTSFNMAREAGFKNINIDLMLGIPMQTVDSIKNTLSNVLKLKPEHISAYSLQIEEGTPFFKLFEQDKLELPFEDQERKIYWGCKRVLEEHGYKHYEISNWAMPGYECRHNLSYWTGVEYVGFGAGAHSYLNNMRISNPEGIKAYIECHNRSETNEIIDLELQMKEFMMLGFRLIEGVSDEDFIKRFGVSFQAVFDEELKGLMEKELIEEALEGERYRLTPKGLDLGNLVFGEFV